MYLQQDCEQEEAHNTVPCRWPKFLVYRPNILGSLVDDLNDKFKIEKKILVETKGLIHNYLGLTIDYSKKNYAIFTMYDYLEDIMKEAPEAMNN